MRLASASRLLSPRASGPCSGGTSKYSPQVARSSQPLRRKDSITWSAAFSLLPSSSTISARVASRRCRSVNPSTTLLSWPDKDRVSVGMVFSVTKPPDKGGFVEQYGSDAAGSQLCYVTKPPKRGGFVTLYCRDRAYARTGTEDRPSPWQHIRRNRPSAPSIASKYHRFQYIGEPALCANL